MSINPFGKITSYHQSSKLKDINSQILIQSIKEKMYDTGVFAKIANNKFFRTLKSNSLMSYIYDENMHLDIDCDDDIAMRNLFTAHMFNISINKHTKILTMTLPICNFKTYFCALADVIEDLNVMHMKTLELLKEYLSPVLKEYGLICLELKFDILPYIYHGVCARENFQKYINSYVHTNKFITINAFSLHNRVEVESNSAKEKLEHLLIQNVKMIITTQDNIIASLTSVSQIPLFTDAF